MATITTSIGGGTTHDQTVDITGVSGSGPWDVTLASAGTNVANGDALWDEHATPRKYLILSGAGTTTLSVADKAGIGGQPDASGTSTAQIKRYYNGSTPITSWWGGVDTDTNLYTSSDDVRGELYSDAVIDESGNVAFSTAKVFVSITLTVASGHEHSGTPGAGVIVRQTSGYDTFTTSEAMTIEGFEVNKNGNSGAGFDHVAANTELILSKMIFHGCSTTSVGDNMVKTSADTITIKNCLGYDWTRTDNGNVYGFAINNGAARPTKIYNCTIHGVTSADGNGYGIYIFQNNSAQNVVNNIVMDCDNDFNFAGTAINGQYNMSSDATADDAGDTTNSLINQTSSNEFVSVAGDNFHLKATANAIGAGLDSTTDTDVPADDVDGDTRDASTPDMGFDEYVAAAGGYYYNNLLHSIISAS